MIKSWCAERNPSFPVGDRAGDLFGSQFLARRTGSLGQSTIGRSRINSAFGRGGEGKGKSRCTTLRRSLRSAAAGGRRRRWNFFSFTRRGSMGLGAARLATAITVFPVCWRSTLPLFVGRIFDACMCSRKRNDLNTYFLVKLVTYLIVTFEYHRSQTVISYDRSRKDNTWYISKFYQLNVKIC